MSIAFFFFSAEKKPVDRFPYWTLPACVPLAWGGGGRGEGAQPTLAFSGACTEINQVKVLCCADRNYLFTAAHPRSPSLNRHLTRACRPVEVVGRANDYTGPRKFHAFALTTYIIAPVRYHMLRHTASTRSHIRMMVPITLLLYDTDTVCTLDRHLTLGICRVVSFVCTHLSLYDACVIGRGLRGSRQVRRVRPAGVQETPHQEPLHSMGAGGPRGLLQGGRHQVLGEQVSVCVRVCVWGQVM